MKKKTKIYIVIFIILISLFSYWFFFIKDYDSRTMVVGNWNYIQLGFNIFPDDGDTLFLHGGDWMLEDFLESRVYPEKMTFYYHKETTGCDTCVGCTTWNHVYRIEDTFGNVIFERELWQEW